MTLGLDLDLYTLKMYLPTEIEVGRPRLSKVRAEVRRDRHRQTRPNALPLCTRSADRKSIHQRICDNVG